MTFRSVLLAPIAAVATTAAWAAPVTLPDGTKAEDVKIGAGAVAQNGQTVTVHYSGWLYLDRMRGKKFDSSRGSRPFTFTLGAGEVIPGWDTGVAGMKVGGHRTLILPPSAGYGAQGDDTIPPNSWLIFDIELVRVE
ncbi:FKBP-type peptidyl-prolyl cis-trans isomerase [Sphingomonas sp. SRS2]|uniref:FKBP-type peptidyl-prolyl cis-trans isomerase n=1 Tax=Sphingomonas sp. SRS2 TaxID=133190 RepID=UPI0006184A66|nr:FKBP-type peptidyl-prolyl cis-trans isomerase [Sphingomonas sp. SRS2]KKC26616.1 peptidylprolyl isomerase [Sphingomonas sp. SRS2]